MAINFDSLPQGRPGYGMAPAGSYVATIEKAEMKNPTTTNPDGTPKKAYMALTLAIQDGHGKSYGKIWDNIFDSESEYVKFKVMRLCAALQLQLSGIVELKDIAKVIAGKKLIVDICEDKNAQQPRMQVDIFSGNVYYPMSEFEQIFGEVAPINASDAADAITPTTDSDTEY